MNRYQPRIPMLQRWEYVNQTYTPKGKPREPQYVLQAINYSRGGKREFKLAGFQISTGGYSASPTEAVNEALRSFFSEMDKGSPEEKLLTAIFGVDEHKPNVEITMQELTKVIKDLQKFYALFEAAFRWEKKLSEAKETLTIGYEKEEDNQNAEQCPEDA